MDSKKTIIYMEPDYADALFWDDTGCNIGGHDIIYLKDRDIDLSDIDGIRDWMWDWEKHDEPEDEIWTDNQWRVWWAKGFLIAQEVKKRLPEDVELHYFTFQEDIWERRPEDSNCGGFWHYGKSLII